MNDLNGDGCDELAIGVRLDNTNGFQNGGGARIMYGFGAPVAYPDRTSLDSMQTHHGSKWAPLYQPGIWTVTV